MRPTLSVISNLRTFCGDYGLYSPQTGLSTRKIKEKRQQHPSERIKDGLVGYNRLSRTKAAKVCRTYAVDLGGFSGSYFA